MEFYVIGTNFRHCPLEIREKISFSGKSLGKGLEEISRVDEISESVIVSTCNRTEIYLTGKESDVPPRAASEFLLTRQKNLKPYLYTFSGRKAFEHLIKVMAGADSQVPGETQIIGQVREALKESSRAGTAGKNLGQIFKAGDSIARKVRDRMKISRGKVSIGSLAVDFIRQTVGSVKGENILIIGAGKLSRLVLNYIDKDKPELILVSNRHYDKARDLARKVDGKAVNFSNFEKSLEKSGIIISTTSSPHPIIKPSSFGHAEKKGSKNPLLIMDLAVPRDVDDRVKNMESIIVYDLDDLKGVSRKNYKNRQKKAKEAIEMIKIKAKEKWKYLRREPEKVL
ncbi:MAG: glutamyl-tRNA reductase [Elusimicrobiota bacterium]